MRLVRLHKHFSQGNSIKISKGLHTCPLNRLWFRVLHTDPKNILTMNPRPSCDGPINSTSGSLSLASAIGTPELIKIYEKEARQLIRPPGQDSLRTTRHVVSASISLKVCFAESSQIIWNRKFLDASFANYPSQYYSYKREESIWVIVEPALSMLRQQESIWVIDVM